MKRLIVLVSLVVVFAFGGIALSSAPIVSARDIVPSCNNDPGLDPAAKGSSTCSDVNAKQTTTSNKLYGPNGVLTKAASLITFAGGIAAVIMILLGGFSFITGSNDANGLAAAKKTILYAIVGLVILVLPSAIIRFVLSKL